MFFDLTRTHGPFVSRTNRGQKTCSYLMCRCLQIINGLGPRALILSRVEDPGTYEIIKHRPTISWNKMLKWIEIKVEMDRNGEFLKVFERRTQRFFRASCMQAACPFCLPGRALVVDPTRLQGTTLRICLSCHD